MKKALYLLDTNQPIYSENARAAIRQLVDIPNEPGSNRVDPALLAEADIIMGGWGTPKMDAEFLKGVPKLQAVFYAAGSIQHIVTDAFWDRGIIICSAWAANAVPVMEYTLSQILFSLKNGHRVARLYRQSRSMDEAQHLVLHAPGAYGSTVGIIGLGMIGRMVVEKLKLFDLHILAYDPFVSAEEARQLGVELTGLENLFMRADVVSLHAPWRKETEGMITGARIASMKTGATFINTARGAIVRESEMIRVLQDRPDLFAVIDVTFPEPPVPESPLWSLPNVLLTPHMAGSWGAECGRMGAYMVEELHRYLTGQPLQWRITAERARNMA